MPKLSLLTWRNIKKRYLRNRLLDYVYASMNTTKPRKWVKPMKKRSYQKCTKDIDFFFVAFVHSKMSCGLWLIIQCNNIICFWGYHPRTAFVPWCVSLIGKLGLRDLYYSRSSGRRYTHSCTRSKWSFQFQPSLCNYLPFFIAGHSGYRNFAGHLPPCYQILHPLLTSTSVLYMTCYC